MRFAFMLLCIQVIGRKRFCITMISSSQDFLELSNESVFTSSKIDSGAASFSKQVANAYLFEYIALTTIKNKSNKAILVPVSVLLKNYYQEKLIQKTNKN